MSTTEFPESQWDAMRAAFESDRAAGVVSFIERFDEQERRQLYSFAQRAFGNRGEQSKSLSGRNFDDYIAIVDAGIAELLRQSAAESDPEQAMKLKDTANIFSFNYTADLAECWPDDDEPRERRHFEAGLRAAENCIRWREELGKPASRKSMAWWGKGMHQLSLKDFDEAVESFRVSLDLAAEDAGGVDISSTSPFGVVLGHGYLGLAEAVLGRQPGRSRYEHALAIFEEQCAGDNAEVKEDAEFGLAQLRKVEQLLDRQRVGA